MGERKILMKKILTALIAFSIILCNTAVFAGTWFENGTGSVQEGDIFVFVYEYGNPDKVMIAQRSPVNGGPRLDSEYTLLMPITVAYNWCYDEIEITADNAKIHHDRRDIILSLTDNTAVIDGKAVSVIHKVVNGYVYVPYTELTTLFDVDVDYDASLSCLTITERAATPIASVLEEYRSNLKSIGSTAAQPTELPDNIDEILAQNIAGAVLGDESIFDDQTETNSLAAYYGAETRYNDIEADNAPYTSLLADRGIINGYPDGTFKPYNTVTRAETAALICRLFNIEPQTYNVFSDVPDTHWASGYIGAIAAMGIINGSGDGTFRPNDFVTYDELFKISILMMGYGVDYYLHPAFCVYPKGTTSLAIRHGFAENLDNLSTTDAASRLDIAKILCNMLDIHLYAIEPIIEDGNILWVEHKDITFSRYLDGEPLNSGRLLRTRADADEWNSDMEAMKARAAEIIKKYNNSTLSLNSSDSV